MPAFLYIKSAAMRKTLFLALLFLLFIATGCAVKVSTTYDKQADFSRYKTFCWLQGCEFTFTGPAYMQGTEINSYLKQSMVDELKKKGFTYDEANPDLLIDFHVTVENKQTKVYRYEQEQFLLLDPATEEDILYFLEGTLVVDVVEKESGRMVWRSQARSYLDLNPDLSEENLRKGIATALKNFPPKGQRN
jgi:hypothetical protein